MYKGKEIGPLFGLRDGVVGRGQQPLEDAAICGELAAHLSRFQSFATRVSGIAPQGYAAFAGSGDLEVPERINELYAFMDNACIPKNARTYALTSEAWLRGWEVDEAVEAFDDMLHVSGGETQAMSDEVLRHGVLDR
jgi:hypothetical protein